MIEPKSANSTYTKVCKSTFIWCIIIAIANSSKLYRLHVAKRTRRLTSVCLLWWIPERWRQTWAALCTAEERRYGANRKHRRQTSCVLPSFRQTVCCFYTQHTRPFTRSLMSLMSLTPNCNVMWCKMSTSIALNSVIITNLQRSFHAVDQTRGQSNLTKSASRGADSPRGHPRGSKVVPLNSWGTVSY